MRDRITHIGKEFFSCHIRVVKCSSKDTAAQSYRILRGIIESVDILDAGSPQISVNLLIDPGLHSFDPESAHFILCGDQIASLSGSREIQF